MININIFRINISPCSLSIVDSKGSNGIILFFFLKKRNFYKNVLCFESQDVSDDNIFATVKHEGAAIHLIQGDDEAALTATRNNISIYIWTKKLDELYATLEPGLSKLPLERVRAPFEQPYGMREFHVKDPDGCLLMFGETIE